MGSLSNLYISQSYQSLIHLGTNNTASANLIELQDGLGNSIGVSVNTGGDLSLSGSLTASLQQGYVWVGNASGKTSLVATSSFIDTFISGNLVTTASFNAYTQSTNIRLNNLETTSASVNISITNLNSTTASQGVSITNLNASSASQQISIDNLNTNSASVNTSISALNTFTASQSTASLVTSITNLNTFSASALVSISNLNASSASQQISIDNLNTNSASVNTSITNINSATASLFTSASLALVTASFDNGTRNLTFTKGNNTTFAVNIPDVSGSTGNFATTGSNVFVGNQTVTGSLFISGNINMVNGADIVTHHVRAQGSNGLELQTSAGTVIVAMGQGGGTQAAFVGAVTANSISASTINGLGDPLAFSTSVDSRLDNLEVSTSSLFTSASLALTTASVTGTTMTFTKGNGTTFNVTLPTGSGGGSTDTGSLMVTGSVNVNILTFTKGDGSTFDLTVAASGSAPAGTVSSSAQILAYNIFATTGSNTFRGTQTISTGDLVMGNGFTINAPSGNITNLSAGNTIQFITEGAAGPGGTNDIKFINRVSGSKIIFENTQGGQGNGIEFTAGYVSFKIAALSGSTGKVEFGSNTTSIEALSTPISASAFKAGAGGINSAGALTASLQQGYAWVGNASGVSSLVATSSFAGGGGGGTTFSNPNLVSNSGSLFIVANTFNSASANLSHISASAQNQSNLVFKNNNNTGNTIISGSNNIFTNPGTPTTGYIKYIGGANNLYLNSSNGINSEITASAISVSGVRPTMNNNIFQGTAQFTINQAVNGGGHTYSNNLFGSPSAVTINALAYTGSSFTLSDNIFKAGVVTLNLASASLAEIATGLSGSGGGGIEVLRNIMNGTGTMAITVGQKVTSGFSSYIGNIVNSTLTVTNISSSVNVAASTNIINQGSTYSNAGAANLAIHRTAGAMSNNFGGMNLIASASAIVGSFNVGTAAMSVTNRQYSGSLGSGSLTFTNNMNAGASNTYTASGSYSGTGPGAAMIGNAVFGGFNTIFTNVEGRGMYADFRSNVIGGQNLILTGSNNSAITASGGGYFGRFNADDGIRNQSAENIFFVGTGTSASNRKTGFLIDSGSNIYVEGTLNVSGSTTITGSLILSSSAATELFVIGESQFSGSVKVASTFQLQLPTGSNQQAGTAVLDGANPGTVTVSNSLVTANSIIMLTKQTLTNAHMVAITAKSAGSFTITSNGNGDADTVGWFIINNS